MILPINHRLSFRLWHCTAKRAPIFLLGLALPLTASAKKGGNGGGGDSPPDPVVPVATSQPVDYISTQLQWENAAEFSDPDFKGIWVSGVNSQGIVVGHVKRPLNSRPDLDDSVVPERRAAINVSLQEGAYVVDHTMRDLNSLFASALGDLNSSPPATGPWRIAYARGFNEAGHILCLLIPNNQLRTYDTNEAASAGVDPVPGIFVQADLSTLTITPVSGNTSPDQEVLEMNENGDVLMQDGPTLRFFEFSNGSFSEGLVPASINRPTFNSNRDFSYDSETVENGRFVTDRLFRTVNGVEELLWERRGKDYDHFNFRQLGVADGDGSVFVATYQFLGGQVSFPEIPYHVKSSTERIQLTEVNADGSPAWLNRPSLSSAQTPGEEELILYLYDTTLEYQIYKPNFGARQQIVFTDAQGGAPVLLTDDLNGGNITNIVISPPWDNNATSDPYDPETTYTGTYYGGYVAFSNWFSDPDRHDAFILSPTQP